MCEYNDLETLDLSENPVLTGLLCSDNELTSINISGCDLLESLNCGYNQLTTLDLTSNSKINRLAIDHMPSLTKVCVWVMPFPVSAYTDGSPNFYFTTDCSK